MGRPRAWLALTAALFVVGVAPLVTAVAASARIAAPALDSVTVRPGGSVTVTVTEQGKVTEFQCRARLDGRPLPATCRATDHTVAPTSGAATSTTTPTADTTVQVTVTVPLTTTAGQHRLYVLPNKVSAERTLQVTYPVVPKVVGLLFTRARAVAATAGLTLCQGPKGLVVEQEPKPGAELSPAVCLAVVTKPAATVPNLLGKALAAARSTLEHSNLVLREPSSTAGVVRAQKPSAGTVVLAGSSVSVTMKPTSTRVPVPDVVGRTVGDAQSLLEPVGLRLSPEDADPQLLVATQAPTAGTRVPLGSAVTVTLKPPTVAVPDVRGTTVGQARATLAGVGLTLGGIPPDADTAARIETQAPAAGALAARGSTVSVTLAGDGLWPVVLRVAGTGGTFVLGVAAGLVAARFRRPAPDGEPDDAAAPEVRLRPRPDTGLDVRLIEPHAHDPRLDVRLEPHDDETVDPVLLEVSS